MKKFLMIAALALVAPLANAGDAIVEAADQAAQATDATIEKAAEIGAMEAAGNTAEEAVTEEAAEMAQETEGATAAAE